MKVKSSRWYKELFVGLLSVSAIALYGNIAPVQSQIVPDDTLDEESSRVTPDVEINGVKSDRIDGGATRGGNLFHSFSEFNVGEGQGAYFTNPAGIENILSRVTGGNPSEILGRLGVTGGDANLFLINPNGIIFGNNASLDVGGSFMATTANGIGLGKDGSFNATEPQTSNLLSVNPSALFFNAVAAQPIINRSQTAGLNGETNSVEDPVGLQVPEGKSLALVGGDVLLEGGNLTLTGGRMELGSVAGVGEVNLNQSGDNLVFGYERIETFGDIRIEGAVVDANEGSANIETGNLIISDGGRVFTGTLSKKDGGNLNVNASESIQVIGGLYPSGLFTETQGSGNAGDLMITTNNLIVRNGASLSAQTEGSGNAGNLMITTDNLIVRDGAQISASTLLGEGNVSEGNAGNLTITTDNLIVRNSAQISANTFSEGKGGNLNINAAESIELIGTTKNGQFPSGLSTFALGDGDAGSLSLSTRQLTILSSNITTRATQSSSGAINIIAGDIRLHGDGDITTDVSTGTGSAGDINLTADSIVAFDDSDILASASNGSGGDINLDTPAFFGDGYRDSDSSINQNSLEGNNRVDNNRVDINATDAFNGIITLPDVSFIQTFLSSDGYRDSISSINQNSLEGNNRADVNATGAFNGIITLPNVSFIQNNLATLPQVFLNTNDLIASSCIARRDRQTGSFIITGNDSLPTPSQSNDSAYPTGTVQTIPSPNFDDGNNRPWKKGAPIIEPTGVYKLPNGELVMSRECSQ